MKKVIAITVIGLGIILLLTSCTTVTVFPQVKEKNLMKATGIQGEATRYVNPIIIIQ